MWSRNLVYGGRNFSQVLADAGHSELDLVTHTLLRALCCVSCRDEEEQEEPEGGGTELRVHLRGNNNKNNTFQLKTPFKTLKDMKMKMGE